MYPTTNHDVVAKQQSLCIVKLLINYFFKQFPKIFVFGENHNFFNHFYLTNEQTEQQ